MKSYLSYITEIDKGPKYSQSFPDDDGPDRFKIDKFLGKHAKRINPEDALPQSGFDAYTGKGIGKDAVVRPSQHLNPGIYGDSPPKKITDYIDDVRQKGLDKHYPETPLKSAMDSLDAQRSASPDHRPPGTPKPPKPANDADLNFFTPEEEAELKKISGDVEDAKKQIAASDVESKLQKNLRKAEVGYDKILKDAGIAPETPPDASPTNVPKVDEYTPEELARRDKIRAGIDAAAERGKATVASDVAKVTQKTEPGMLSRMGTIAKTVAKNPLMRVGGKLLGAAAIPLGVYGVYQDAKTAGDMQVKNVKREMEQSRREGRPYREPLPTNPGFKF